MYCGYSAVLICRQQRDACREALSSIAHIVCVLGLVQIISFVTPLLHIDIVASACARALLQWDSGAACTSLSSDGWTREKFLNVMLQHSGTHCCHIPQASPSCSRQQWLHNQSPMSMSYFGTTSAHAKTLVAGATAAQSVITRWKCSLHQPAQRKISHLRKGCVCRTQFC